MTIRIESDSFDAGERIPPRYAVGVPDGDGRAAPAGGDVSPHLRWGDVPTATRSLVVLCVDEDVPAEAERMNAEGETIEPDAPRRPLAHWLVADVPPQVREIPEGVASDGLEPRGKPTGPTSFGGRTGANGYTDFFAGDEELAGTYGGYDGPFPPWNDELEHRYRFRVLALDVPRLELPEAFTLEQLRTAVDGHVLDEGELVGTYSVRGAQYPARSTRS